MKQSLCRASFFLAALGSLAIPSRAQFPPAPGTGPGLPETIEAIDSARVTTRILYVTAHPDDESSAVLTYLARGLHADVALLSLTRGEGGQNALGPEQAPQLGLIRTQELLAATRGYGVKLYFTRAKDFGFSKTPEETEKIWGDQVLEDMVRVIRTFRPNIVINNWGGVHGGHGHHQASGILTPKAVAMAADSSAFPEQLKEGWTVWGAAPNAVQILDLDRFSDKLTGYVLPLDDVSPLWGKTWREIGIDAFANHRTQGVSVFLGSPFLRRPIALKRQNGGMPNPGDLARGLTSLIPPSDCTGKIATYCEALKDADAKIGEAARAALNLDWATSTGQLEAARADLARLLPPCDIKGIPWPLSAATVAEVSHSRGRLSEALLMAAGFTVTADADRSEVVRGEDVEVVVRYRCRAGVECPVKGPLPIVPEPTSVSQDGDFTVLKYTLKSAKQAKESNIWNQLLPNAASAFSIELLAGGRPPCQGALDVPVVHIAADSTHVTRVPLRIVPAYTLAVEPKQVIEPLAGQHKPFDILLRVHSYSTKNASVVVGLDVPQGWQASVPVEEKFEGEGDRYAKLTVTPPQNLSSGNFTITPYVKRGDEKFTTSLEPLVSMPTLLWEEPATSVVHAFDVKVPENLRVGYISAEGEPVPDALRMLGIRVEMLNPEAVTFGDLSKYDAIVIGVRAYELRDDLRAANQRFLEYAANGGTLVVQYQRDFAWNRFRYAPYPAKIEGGPSQTRITDETAPVRFLKPNDTLLNQPNKITQDDFVGWVQERGLYFWSDFDAQYTPLLAMNDPGEKDLTGGLVYAKYGKGTYIYTGIAFFRQLPEGVSGAYRLFVNLLSASRVHENS